MKSIGNLIDNITRSVSPPLHSYALAAFGHCNIHIFWAIHLVKITPVKYGPGDISG